jgi:hypothetical protein
MRGSGECAGYLDLQRDLLGESTSIRLIRWPQFVPPHELEKKRLHRLSGWAGELFLGRGLEFVIREPDCPPTPAGMQTGIETTVAPDLLDYDGAEA